MIKMAVRNLHSTKPTPPRFCDVIVNGEEVQLEIKIDKRVETIPWEDVLHQVEVAKEMAAKKAVNE